MTPLHIAILGLAAWSLILAVLGLPEETIDRATGPVCHGGPRAAF